MHRVSQILSHLTRKSYYDNKLQSLTTQNESNPINTYYGGHHDIGGSNDFKSAKYMDRDHTSLAYWEKKTDAFCGLLAGKVYNLPQFRKTIESIPKTSYLNLSYYEKWLYTAIKLLLDAGTITESELGKQFESDARIIKLRNNEFKIPIKKGDYVQVRDVTDHFIPPQNWRLFLGLKDIAHIRVPGFIVGRIGKITDEYTIPYPNDELEAFGIDAIPVPMYRVRFNRKHLFLKTNEPKDSSKHSEYHHQEHHHEHHGHTHTHSKPIVPKIDDAEETIDVDIFVHWLQKVDSEQRDMSHESREEVERNAIDKEQSLCPWEVMCDIAVKLCVKKGLFSMDKLQKIIHASEQGNKEMLGQKIVIKAWKEPKWKRLLIEASNKGDARAFVAKTFDEYHDYNALKIVENTERLQNVAVCTLCSCYPRPILGIPPAWYKSLKYRSEIVSNTRKLLKDEFGTYLNDNIKINIYDSTSNLRYLILPHLPSQIPGWETMSDRELKNKISRDMLIGVQRYVR
eukprot:30409_1